MESGCAGGCRLSKALVPWQGPAPQVRPNLVDRAVGYFFPQAQVNRLRARAVSSLVEQMYGGGYIAGRSDRKATQNWTPHAGSADTDINPGLRAIRARTRDLTRNTPLAAGAVNTTVTSTIGSGLTAQPRVDREGLGLTDEEADAWESRAKRIWRFWAESTACDLEGELNFYALQSLAFRSALESGDVLKVHRWRERAGDPFGTRVQLVEADRISNPNWEHDGPRLSQGVEIGADGEVLRYWVMNGHPGDRRFGRGHFEWAQVPVRTSSGTRISWLLFDKRRVGQRRGVPYLAPVVEPLKQLDRYTESELMAALISSMFTVFVKTEAGAGGFTGIEGEAPDGRGELSLAPGLITELLEGESIETANPARPNAQFDPFVTAIYRQMGVALEIPFEILIKHFQSSYSASRGAMLEAWKFWRGRREWMGEQFCEPSYRAVITEAVARGWLDAPGFFEDPFIRDAWLDVAWSGDALPQLDPLKEVRASKLAVEEGFSTRQRESMALNGTDWEENHRQRVKEERARERDGLVGATAAAGSETPSTDPANEEAA